MKAAMGFTKTVRAFGVSCIGYYCMVFEGIKETGAGDRELVRLIIQIPARESLGLADLDSG
jgi:hypothetical protein